MRSAASPRPWPDIAQAALRARLVADLETARVSNETERLRSALLSGLARSALAAGGHWLGR
ncbi:hypothetical protein [Hylemonella gracilis]|uniref:hypothetical protein n=1 Tax=Hylemonella gracilis TaxID=80880 RepID=UPI001F6138A4